MTAAFDAVIEIPKGSRNKYEVDHETGRVYLDRVLYTGFAPAERPPRLALEEELLRVLWEYRVAQTVDDAEYWETLRSEGIGACGALARTLRERGAEAIFVVLPSGDNGPTRGGGLVGGVWASATLGRASVATAPTTTRRVRWGEAGVMSFAMLGRA